MKGGGGPNIPSDYTLKFGGTAGPTIQVDYDLDNIHVKELPRFEIGVTEFPPVTVNSNIAITAVPPLTSNVNIAIKEVPEQRVHYPSHYQIGFSLFGMEIWSISLCGEAQTINEKYVPRRTEDCK